MTVARFTNSVKVEWLPDSRKMRLLETITFIDSAGIYWFAKKDSVIDGASIPRFFWRVIGSPFCGKYRDASVIHDVYCKNKHRSAKATHKMLQEASLCKGVSKGKAWVMYNAVRWGGPKW